MMSGALFPQIEHGDDLTERIRCPVHGFIRYSKRERQVIDHSTFQRLRNIRQLALCYYVYPGAVHSRFEHSLGVMEMATRAFDALELKYRNLLIAELEQIPELRSDSLKRGKQTVRLLALLHDVGHGAFSHAAETALPGGKKHEDISVYVIESVLKDTLESLFFEGITGLLVRIMRRSPEVVFLRQFVVGEMDMDRTDYLWRDSIHCGVDYGKFDFRRLIESLAVLTHPDFGSLQIGIERGGEHTFEALLLARYQMNTQVYYHKTRRIYDHYLTEYMAAWGKEHYKTFDDVLKYDDLRILVQIGREADEDPNPRSIVNRISKRRHHKVVFETGDSADAIKLRLAKRVYGELQKQYAGVDFWLDDEAKGSIHKLTTPGEHEAIEDFYIVEKTGQLRLVTQDSAMLEKIPRQFRNVRIYADAEPGLLKEVANRAREIERGL